MTWIGCWNELEVEEEEAVERSSRSKKKYI